MNIEYLPVATDVRMKIDAETPEALFVAGLKGMNEMLKKGACLHEVDLPRFQELHTYSIDYACLLVDLLSDILALSLAHNAIYCEMKILELSEIEIIVELYGIPVDSFDEEIIKVSYHEAWVRQLEDGRWQSEVHFEV